jgi:hypothetical protein
MQIFRVFTVFVVVFGLLMASTGAFASACICNHTPMKEGVDCHKHTAKQEKKSCCCDKAMGCKVSFNILGGGETLAFLSSPISYAL